MGAEPPWSSGKDSKGNRLEIGSLWRFLSPLSLAAKKAARRRRRDERTNHRDKRRIRRKAGTSPAAAGLTSQSSGFREVAHAHRCAVGPHSGREGPTLGRACYPSRGMRRRMPAPLSGEPILPAAAGIPLIRRFAPASPRESQSPLQRKTKAPSSPPSGHLPPGEGNRCNGAAFPWAQQAAQPGAVPHTFPYPQCIIALSPMLWKSCRASCMNSSLGGSTLLSLYLMPSRSYLVAPNLW